MLKAPTFGRPTVGLSGIFSEGFPTCLPAGRRALPAGMTQKNKHSNNDHPAVSAAGFFTVLSRGLRIEVPAVSYGETPCKELLFLYSLTRPCSRLQEIRSSSI